MMATKQPANDAPEVHFFAVQFRLNGERGVIALCFTGDLRSWVRTVSLAARRTAAAGMSPLTAAACSPSWLDGRQEAP